MPATRDKLRSRARVLRLAELVLLFVVVPAAAAALVDPSQRFGGVLAAVGVDRLVTLPVELRGLVFPSLFVFSLPMLVVLLRDPTFDNRQLWNGRAFRRDARRILGLMLVGWLVMVGFTLALMWVGVLPEGGLFGLPRRNPELALFILIGYPIVSCYPQEVSHRAFFFHRYEPVFGRGWALIVVNAAAFGWYHAVFWSPWALGMTFTGGLLFAWTYSRTRSVLAVTVEHALYGWWAFMTGAGWFVYAGSVGH